MKTPYCRQDDLELREKRSLEAALYCEDPSLTQQGHALEADINHIAKAYGLTGKPLPVPPEALDARYYGDLSDAPDLRTVLDRVREAEDHFMRLPPDLRHRFHDSPGVLWDFVNDPRNADEAVALGLLHRRPDPATSAPTGANTNAGDTPPA